MARCERCKGCRSQWDIEPCPYCNYPLKRKERMTKLTNDINDPRLFLPFAMMFVTQLNKTWKKFNYTIEYDKETRFNMSCWISMLNKQILTVGGEMSQVSGEDMGDITLTYKDGKPKIIRES